MPDDSFPKYEAEIAIELYEKTRGEHPPEPQRKDFATEVAYRACLEAWIQEVEDEDLFDQPE